MATPEELVLRIKTGETRLYTDLWEISRKSAYLTARRYIPRDGSNSIEVDDLMQEAFIGMMQAVKTFIPNQGYGFFAHMKWPVMQKCAELVHKRHHENDALDKAASEYYRDGGKDGNEAGELTPVLETVPDDQAAEAFDLINDKVDRESEFAVVISAFHQLNPETQEVIQQYFCSEKTLEQIEQETGISWAKAKAHRGIIKIREILKSQGIEKRLDAATQYYRSKGVSAFSTSGTSVVEDIVDWREEKRNRLQYEAEKKDRQHSDIEKIIAVLPSLKPLYRTTLLRHYFNNESYAEMSRQSGNSSAWARATARRAIRETNSLLKGEKLESGDDINQLLSIAPDNLPESGFDWRKWMKESSERKAV